MSFSDPVHIIDHIPRDFDMKRITLSSLADFVSTRKVNHCQPL